MNKFITNAITYSCFFIGAYLIGSGIHGIYNDSQLGQDRDRLIGPNPAIVHFTTVPQGSGKMVVRDLHNARAEVQAYFDATAMSLEDPKAAKVTVTAITGHEEYNAPKLKGHKGVIRMPVPDFQPKNPDSPYAKKPSLRETGEDPFAETSNNSSPIVYHDDWTPWGYIRAKEADAVKSPYEGFEGLRGIRRHAPLIEL
jgi:hypothetical protein